MGKMRQLHKFCAKAEGIPLRFCLLSQHRCRAGDTTPAQGIAGVRITGGGKELPVNLQQDCS